MYQLKLEPQFKKDYQRLKHHHPELIDELMNTLNQLHLNGIVNAEYRPHILICFVEAVGIVFIMII